MEVLIFNGNIDQALKKLREKLGRDRTLTQFKERSQGFQKPSIKRRKKHQSHLNRLRRLEMRLKIGDVCKV